MVDRNLLAADGVAAELSAVLPPFDPTEPSGRDRNVRLVVGISLLLHLVVLWFFWDWILGAVVEEEETVVVSMIQDEPEPEKPRPKLLAQRTIDTQVRQFKEVAQHEIQVVRPVPVLSEARKVDVAKVELAQAPKPIVQREIETRKIDVFGEVTATPKPVQIDRQAPTVRSVQTARPTAGPRKTQAAAPVNVSPSAEVVAPTLARGVVSQSAVDGDVTGARVADLQAGTSASDLRGDGDRGRFAASAKDCMKDPVCRAYIEEIRRRVYARWNPGFETSDGEVRLRFKVDRGGSAHGIELVRAGDRLLGDSCVTAFRHASPFPPPPKEILYIVNKSLVATFDYSVVETLQDAP